MKLILLMLRPCKNLILIDPEDYIAEQEKKSGIILPDYELIMPYKGKVLAIGKNVQDIKVGDTIIFDRVRVDNKIDRWGKIDNKYLLVPENLVFAKYECISRTPSKKSARKNNL